MASTPSASICHSFSGESTPPGKRQAMATIAIGSLRAATYRLFCCRRRSFSSIDARSAATI